MKRFLGPVVFPSVAVFLLASSIPALAQAKRKPNTKSVAKLSAKGTGNSTCNASGNKPEVLVKSKTTLRRGPGLNYPAVKVLVAAKCFLLGEVSMDETWVLVERGELFGWVRSGGLSKSSQTVISKIKPDRAPIGSGQTRGYVWTNQSTSLKDTPQSHSKTLRLVAKAERVLALAATGDGIWIQVRDLRGEAGWIRARHIRDETGVLAGVPRTSRGVQIETVRVEDRVTRTILMPMRQGVLIDAQLALGMMMPRLSLDSNGTAFYRRYEISALAPALSFKAQTSNWKPVLLGFEYSMAILGGLKSELAESAVGGRVQDSRISVGWPIQVSGLWFLPRVAYSFSDIDLDAVFPGDPLNSGSGVTFVSYRLHGATLGFELGFSVIKEVSGRFSLNGLIGTANEFPIDLGESQVSFGGDAQLGLRYALSDSLGLAFDVSANYQSSPFTGDSASDPSVSKATLTRAQVSMFLGAVFVL